jgi:glycosyltransferase involved in cell wall biosynthesis
VPYWGSPLHSSTPTIVTVHDLIPLLLREYRGGPLVRLYTALVSRAAQNAALVITDSEASKRDIITHLKRPSRHVRAIPLAPGEAYQPSSTSVDAEVRARYSLTDSYMLYLGGFDVRKNVQATVAAYRRAARTIGATHPLVIAGRLPEQDTPFAPDPRRLIQKLGLDANLVHFSGFVTETDKPALYRGATAFVFPSHYEGFGLPPLEALACGTPVVTSNTSSLPEVVGAGGILLAPNDIAGIADALTKIATEPDFRAQLSQRALAQAAKFSWARTAQETLAVYEKVTAR